MNDIALSLTRVSKIKRTDEEIAEQVIFDQRLTDIMSNVSYEAKGIRGSRFGEFRYNCTPIASFKGPNQATETEKVCTLTTYGEELEFASWTDAHEHVVKNADALYAAKATWIVTKEEEED